MQGYFLVFALRISSTHIKGSSDALARGPAFRTRPDVQSARSSPYWLHVWVWQRPQDSVSSFLSTSPRSHFLSYEPVDFLSYLVGLLLACNLIIFAPSLLAKILRGLFVLFVPRSVRHRSELFLGGPARFQGLYSRPIVPTPCWSAGMVNFGPVGSLIIWVRRPCPLAVFSWVEDLSTSLDGSDLRILLALFFLQPS